MPGIAVLGDNRVIYKDKAITPENVINEIGVFKRLYGTSQFMFWDDSFTFNKGESKNIVMQLLIPSLR